MPSILLIILIGIAVIGSVICLVARIENDFPWSISLLVWIATAGLITWFCYAVNNIEPFKVVECTVQETSDGTVQFVQVGNVLVNLNAKLGRTMPKGAIVERQIYKGAWSYGVYMNIFEDEYVLKDKK